MALSPAPEGSPGGRFAALLRHHMRVGTRPAGKRGSGTWSPDALAAAAKRTRRTIEYYANASSLPPDISDIADAFFGDDPRHLMARNAFLIAFAEATGTDPPPWTSATSNVPVRVPTHFLGRNEQLAAIETGLGRYAGPVAVAALHGLRGVGKTTLAAVYADQHRNRFRATWWIRAQTVATIRADLIALGIKLGWIDDKTKEEPALEVIIDRLRQEGAGILLIFDNASRAADILSYLPRSGEARVIITSNAPDWRNLAEPIQVHIWPKDVGAEYLIARTGQISEQKAAEKLSELLGGLPLAHEQAAAYCERLTVGFTEYGHRFVKQPVKLLEDERYVSVDYGLTVGKTFGLAIEAAAKLHPAAEPLLKHAALLPPESIPLFLFQEGRAFFDEPLASQLDEDGIDEAVAALRAFALIDRETTTGNGAPTAAKSDTVRLHRLVREIAASRISPETRDDVQRALIKVFESVYPKGAYNDSNTWSRARELDTITLSIITGDLPTPTGVETHVASLLDRLASYRHRALGTYTSARNLFERALKIREQALGPEHPESTMSMNNLAGVLWELGDLAGARALMERVIAVDEKRHGPNHLNTALDLNNLAVMAHAQSDFEEARMLFERILPILERELGPEDQRVATTLNNIALVYHALGDIIRARPLHERALEIREKVLEPEHPDIAQSLSNLALLAQDEGKFAEARLLFERTIAIDEKILGPEHPEIAVDLCNLARVFERQKDFQSAISVQTRALAIRERTLGPDHPLTQKIRQTLKNLSHTIPSSSPLEQR